MRKIVLLLVMAVGLFTAAIAQPKSITGRVVDKDGKPVSGATIVVKGVTKGIADENGNFKAVVKPGEVVTISSINGKKEFKVTAASIYDVTLEEVQTVIDEVVVTTGLGIKRNAKSFGGAATTISSKTLTQGKAVNIQQALNGKVSGVNISTVNGGVFEESKINIRGIRSLTGNNQPLLIVDGVPFALSFLSTIPPDDIQDVTVLKSAASAALYGQDGVNGVILLTTKKGAKKPSINFSTTFQANRVAFFPKLQKTYGGGAGEVVDEYGNYGYVPYENQQFGPAFDGSIQDIGIKLEDGTIQRGKYSNDHYKDKIKFWNTGYTIQNSVSLSGEDFYFGIQDANIKGSTPGDVNRRTSFRFNSGKSYNNFSISYGLNYVLQNYDIFYQGGTSGLIPAYTGSLFDQILQTANNIPFLDYKDWRNNKFAQFSNYYNEYGINPYWLVDNLRSKGKQDFLTGNIDLNYKIRPWLKATVKASSSFRSDYVKSNVSAIEVSDWANANRDNTTYSNRPGSSNTSTTTTSRINVDYFLSGENQFKKDYSIKYVLGGMIRENKTNDVSVDADNLIVPGLYNNSNTTSSSITLPKYGDGNYETKTRVLSYYGSLGLGYKGWANIEFTGRNDWDSRLLPKYRSFFYPGVNAAVVLSDAIPYIKENKFISFLKVRGAYSKSGNVNVNVYSLQATYSQPSGVATSGFPYASVGGYTANNTFPSGDLKPEFVYTKEVGLEFGLFKNRINFEGTYFTQDNKDQVLNVTQSSATGYTTAIKNAASFRNYGVELDLGLNPLINIGKSASINLKLNATYNDNKITETFNNSIVNVGGNSGFISQYASAPTVNMIAAVGLPAFAFQLTDYNRDTITGSPTFGKVIVNSTTGVPSVASKLVTMGRSLPKYVIGITPSFNWKDLSISMTWEYKGGHDFYSGLGPVADNSGISQRSAEYGRKRFVFPNSVYMDDKGKYVENTSIQVFDGNYGFWTSGTNNTSVATNYFSSAAAWRLRELNISYSLPNKLVSKLSFIKKVTLSAIGRNLLLLTPKSNQWGDPEYNYSSSGNTYGVSSSYQTPSSRFYGATINIQF